MVHAVILILLLSLLLRIFFLRGWHWLRRIGRSWSRAWKEGEEEEEDHLSQRAQLQIQQQQHRYVGQGDVRRR